MMKVITIVVSGDQGVGKTTTLAAIREMLAENTDAAIVSDPEHAEEDAIEGLMDLCRADKVEFRLVEARAGYQDMIKRLEEIIWMSQTAISEWKLPRNADLRAWVEANS